MDILSSMLDLTRRLPPTKLEENVDALMQISPDYADDLSGNVDQPLKLRVDKTTGKEFLACVYNQDGESYRCVTAPFRRVRWAVLGRAVLIDDTFFVLRFCSSLPTRSPWSNEYDPPSEDGPVPPPKLRKLEIAANEAFDTYREM
jgi:capping protein beta